MGLPNQVPHDRPGKDTSRYRPAGFISSASHSVSNDLSNGLETGPSIGAQGPPLGRLVPVCQIAFCPGAVSVARSRTCPRAGRRSRTGQVGRQTTGAGAAAGTPRRAVTRRRTLDHIAQQALGARAPRELARLGSAKCLCCQALLLWTALNQHLADVGQRQLELRRIHAKSTRHAT